MLGKMSAAQLLACNYSTLSARAEDFTARKLEEQKRTAEIITIEKVRMIIDCSIVHNVATHASHQRCKVLCIQDYAPSSGQYRPKVATWGVFERPANISKAFGGGRNLRPGGILEDENATAERKRRVALVRSYVTCDGLGCWRVSLLQALSADVSLLQALSKYKKEAGLEIDLQVEQRAEELFQEGMALFDRGQLQASLLKFEVGTRAGCSCW